MQDSTIENKVTNSSALSGILKRCDTGIRIEEKGKPLSWLKDHVNLATEALPASQLLAVSRVVSEAIQDIEKADKEIKLHGRDEDGCCHFRVGRLHQDSDD